MYVLQVKVSALTFTLLPGTNSYANFLGLLRIFFKKLLFKTIKKNKNLSFPL